MGVTNSLNTELRMRTEKKFISYDRAVDEGWMEGTDYQRLALAEMLLDPTIYMYAFFKNPNDPGDRFKTFYYQDALLNDPRDRIIFAAARQIGKSEALCIKALTFALQYPGTTTMIISKTLPQSKDLLRKIRRLLNFCVLDYKSVVGDTENKTEITFNHTDTIINVEGKEEETELSPSRVICVPSTEAARGYSVDLLLIDELAFYEDSRYFYYEIAEPTTYATKGKIMCFSNPNGQTGSFWELWNDNSFSKYNFNFLDCPLNTQEEYDRISARLTLQERNSTLDAVFTDPLGGFFTLAERKAIQHDRSNTLPLTLSFDNPLHVAFDFAKSQDRTVRTIGSLVERDGKQGVYVYELFEYPSGTPYNEIIDDLENLIKEVGFNNFASVGWDNTGVGRGIEDFVKRIRSFGISCVPIEFSLQNKSRIYTIFKLLAERSARGDLGIDIPFVQECDRQLANLRFKRTSGSRYLQVHHEKDSDLDDFADSLAALCSLIVQPDSPPIHLSVIGNTDLEDEFRKIDKKFGTESFDNGRG